MTPAPALKHCKTYYRSNILHPYTDPPRWWEGTPAPALIHCKTYYKSSILHPDPDPKSNHTPASPLEGGRRTSPACGSCRRPRKIFENQGIENQKEKTTRPPYDKSEKIRKEEKTRKTKREQRGEREREKGQTLTCPMKERQRPSREGTKGIIFLSIFKQKGVARKNQ